MLNIPAGYQQVMPYLIIKDAAAFLKFMQDIFGASEKIKHMRGENVIMHAEITIGECVIMFADSTDQFPPRTGGFFIYVADADETYHKAIAAGAVAESPMSDQPYGRSGGIKDQFGNTWWVTTAAQSK
jgi:PhnB protein